jgi:hypothetical protein
MKKTRLYKVNKFLGQMVTGERCPEIRWGDVVRIEAFGTDVVSAFAIVLTFHYADGSSVCIHPEQRGYYDVVEALDQRCPSISAEWFEEMQTAYKHGSWPGDVERVLYSAEKENSFK